MSTSYNVFFMARILSVVHAIQPWPGSSLSACMEPGDATGGCLDARRSASRKGMSWTPIVKSGRSRTGGAVSARRSVTARGMLEMTDMS